MTVKYFSFRLCKLQKKYCSFINSNTYIPKVTLKVINQDRMFFADFSVNCQPISMKFCNNLQQNPNIPGNFVKLYIVFQKLDHLTCNKFKLRRPSINPLN